MNPLCYREIGEFPYRGIGEGRKGGGTGRGRTEGRGWAQRDLILILQRGCSNAVGSLGGGGVGGGADD